MILKKICLLFFFGILSVAGACSSSYKINPDKMTAEEKLALPPEFNLRPLEKKQALSPASEQNAEKAKAAESAEKNAETKK